MKDGKTIFKGATEDQAKFNAVSSGYIVVGTAFNSKKRFWVAFARKTGDKIF